MLDFGNVLKQHLSPNFGSWYTFEHSCWEDEIFWSEDFSSSVFVAAIEPYDDYEIALKTLDNESWGSCAPPALDLNASRTVLFRISGDKVVAGHVCVCLVARNSMH